MNNIKEYLPAIYKDVQETEVITDIENELFSELANSIVVGKNNEFILTANVDGISNYEQFLGIPLTGTEDLEFRRQRVLNRFSTSQVFTKKSLMNKLDSLLGENNYILTIDYNKYELTIESSANNQQWYEEILVTINSSKPANILFINKPAVTKQIRIGESISYTQMFWNYRLGTVWELGRLPFTSYKEMGEHKIVATPSIKQELLNDIALATATDVAKVRINDSYLIDVFITKQSQDNVVTIEYRLPTSSGLTEANKIELLDSENNVLTESAIYVPLLEDVILKHTIKVQEG
jgi:hypothetical protein